MQKGLKRAPVRSWDHVEVSQRNHSYAKQVVNALRIISLVALLIPAHCKRQLHGNVRIVKENKECAVVPHRYTNQSVQPGTTRQCLQKITGETQQLRLNCCRNIDNKHGLVEKDTFVIF